MLFKGEIKGNKPYFKDRTFFDKWIEQYEGKEVIFTIEKFDATRTTAYQYRYYYSAIVEPLRTLLKDRGYDLGKDEADIFLKSHLLRDVTVDPLDGTELVILGRKTKLSKDEMKEYIEKCIRFCAEEFELIIKDSDEYFKI